MCEKTCRCGMKVSPWIRVAPPIMSLVAKVPATAELVRSCFQQTVVVLGSSFFGKERYIVSPGADGLYIDCGLVSDEALALLIHALLPTFVQV